MRAAISLLVLLLSMCVQTESQGTDASIQDVSTELKELRDMVVELRATLRHNRDDVKVLEAKVAVLESDNVAMKQRLAVSEGKVEVLEAENKAMKERLTVSEADNVAVKAMLVASESKVEALEKEIKAAPKVAFSAALKKSEEAHTTAGSNDLNVVFKRVITNVGEAYSSTTGFFTAPVRGVYYFRFTAMDIPHSRALHIRMFKNGERLMHLNEFASNGVILLSSGLTLQLEKGDTVNMVLPAGSRFYDDNGYNYSTFSGFLLFHL